MSAKKKQMLRDAEALIKKSEEHLAKFDVAFERARENTDQRSRHISEDVKAMSRKTHHLHRDIKLLIDVKDLVSMDAVLRVALRNTEERMEAFFAFEQNVKIKPFSASGLQREDKQEQALTQTLRWLQEASKELRTQHEQLDFEIGKKKNARSAAFKAAELRLERSQFHEQQLDRLQRGLQTGALAPCDVDDLRFDVEAFVEAANDPSFKESDPDMYDAFDVPDAPAEAVVAPVDAERVAREVDDVRNKRVVVDEKTLKVEQRKKPAAKAAPKLRTGGVDPGDRRPVEVDGVRYQRFMLVETRGLGALQHLTRCEPHLASRACQAGDQCLRAHFCGVTVRRDGKRFRDSAGRYSPTVGLTRCLVEYRVSEVCTEHLDGHCRHGEKCRFLHVSEPRQRDVTAAQRALTMYQRSQKPQEKKPRALPVPRSEARAQNGAAKAEPINVKSKPAAEVPVVRAAVPEEHRPQPQLAADTMGVLQLAAALCSPPLSQDAFDFAASFAKDLSTNGPLLLHLLPRLYEAAESNPSALLLHMINQEGMPLLSDRILDLVATRPSSNLVDCTLQHRLLRLVARILAPLRRENVDTSIARRYLEQVHIVGIAQLAHACDNRAPQDDLDTLRHALRSVAGNIAALDADLEGFIDSYLGPASKAGRWALLNATGTLSKRLMRVSAALESSLFPDTAAPWDTLLLFAESWMQAHTLEQLVITDCSLAVSFNERSTPPCLIKSDRKTPSGALWLDLRIDHRKTLPFLQWNPPLFVGQWVEVQLQGSPLPSLKFEILRAEMLQCTIALVSKQKRQQWPPDAKLTVRFLPNIFSCKTLVRARRHLTSTQFLRRLRGEEGGLRPCNPQKAAGLSSESEAFNQDLDDEQLGFVNGVLQQPRLAVIIGPPGTGKTHTLVAAIEAITNLKRGRVLACASNVLAANNLAKLLLQTGVRTLRIFTKSTSPLDVRDSEFRSLLRFSNGVVDPVSNARVEPENFVLDSIFENATPELIASYDVVCITTAHTEFLQRTGVQFDFVIVDEAPQSVEAETLIPILSLPEATTLVLAGDVRQLGPALVSSVAEENGLGLSLLHKHAKYMRDDPRILCTVLKRCYRCHPAILDIFSSRFYNNTLVPAGENYVHLQCRYAPDPDHPIFFAHVPTTEVDTQEDCNVVEAAVVVSIVLRLLRDNGLSLSNGIGIVTPYRSQVLEIKKALWHAVLAQRLPEQHTHNILVGTVDQFQGQSRTVMLLSMVRPTRDEALTGSILTRGFVGNDPKSNVALSRAESLMCIVGDAEGLLQHSEADPWRTLITGLAQRGLVWAGASIQHDVDTEEVAPLRDDEADDAADEDDGSSDDEQ